jgi:hypothetical protein
VALNVCVKPLVDQLFISEFAGIAGRNHDHIDAQFLKTFVDDFAWQRTCTDRLLDLATKGDRSNADALPRHVRVWLPRAQQAIAIAASVLGPSGADAAERATKTIQDLAATVTRGTSDAA